MICWSYLLAKSCIEERLARKKLLWKSFARKNALDKLEREILLSIVRQNQYFFFFIKNQTFIYFVFFLSFSTSNTWITQLVFFFNKLVFMSLFQISKDYTHVKLLTSFSCDNRLLRPMPLLYNNAISYKPNRMKGTCNNRTYMKYWLRENTLNVHTHPNLFIMTFFYISKERDRCIVHKKIMNSIRYQNIAY